MLLLTEEPKPKRSTTLVPLLVVVAIMASIVATGVYFIARDQRERDARQDRKVAWYHAHHCEPGRYFAVGGLNIRVYRVYVCEGREYIWEDIPDEEAP